MNILSPSRYNKKNAVHEYVEWYNNKAYHFCDRISKKKEVALKYNISVRTLEREIVKRCELVDYKRKYVFK